MNANVYLANFLRGFFCEAQRAFTPVTFHLKLKTLQFIFFTRFSFRNLIRHCFFFFFFYRTRFVTICLCTAGSCAYRTRARGKARGGCWTLKEERAVNRRAAEPPPWTTTASSPRAAAEPLRRRWDRGAMLTLMLMLPLMLMPTMALRTADFTNIEAKYSVVTEITHSKTE